MNQVQNIIDTIDNPIYFVAALLDEAEYGDDWDHSWLYMIIASCISQMLGIGLSPEQCIETMDGICTSNESKSIKKTASNVKANDGDKGAYYVPPTAGLTKILEERNYVSE